MLKFAQIVEIMTNSFRLKSLWVFVIVLTGIALSGCHNWPSDDVLSVSPLWGRWTLESIDGTPVASGQRTRYIFSQDPDNMTFNSGNGKFERYDAATDTWLSSAIEWEVLPENGLTVTGLDGNGTFEFMLTSGQVRTELRLYDAATRREQVFLKNIE